ncbi:tetratricopeptide repeat protein [Alphaproteobacteria bacterium]|nr:tetratricopeptide repeat protein [Alphaproteobacteria bacterium]
MLTPITKIQTAIRTVSLSNRKENTLIANLLFFIVIVFMFSFNSAFAAGSTSSKQEKTSTTHSKEYYKAVKLIKASNFKDAISLLETLVTKNPDDADILNYLGFSFRKTGDLVKSSHYYEKALNINPNHLGALEYQGELFITLGKIDRAKANLTRIDDICVTQCKELRELEKAINAALNK